LKGLNHWAFIPFLTVLGLVAGNLLVFAEGGYLDYRNLSFQKEIMEKQISELDARIASTRGKLQDADDPDKMIRNFEREYLVFKDKVQIIKFEENSPRSKTPTEEQKNLYDLKLLQNIYIIAASILLVFVSLIAYRRAYRRQNTSPDDSTRKFY